MSRYTDFSKLVYSCIESAETLWPYDHGEPADIDRDKLVSEVVDRLGKLKQKLDEIDNSGVDLEDLSSGCKHAAAVAMARLIYRFVMEAAYGVSGLPARWLPEDISDYAERVTKNWSEVSAALQEWLPHRPSPFCSNSDWTSWVKRLQRNWRWSNRWVKQSDDKDIVAQRGESLLGGSRQRFVRSTSQSSKNSTRLVQIWLR